MRARVATRARALLHSIIGNAVDVAGAHAAQPSAEDLPRQLDACSHECALAQYILQAAATAHALLSAMQHKPLRAAATAADFRGGEMSALALPPFTKVEAALDRCSQSSARRARCRDTSHRPA